MSTSEYFKYVDSMIDDILIDFDGRKAQHSDKMWEFICTNLNSDILQKAIQLGDEDNERIAYVYYKAAKKTLVDRLLEEELLG